MKTKTLIKELSKDTITQSALKELRLNGCCVQKNHNVGAYKRRQYQIEKGVCDIVGYSRQGLHVECEVKTLNDKFSKEQIDRLSDLDKKGGIALVAVQIGSQVKIIPFKEYFIEKFIKS